MPVSKLISLFSEASYLGFYLFLETYSSLSLRKLGWQHASDDCNEGYMSKGRAPSSKAGTRGLERSFTTLGSVSGLLSPPNCSSSYILHPQRFIFLYRRSFRKDMCGEGRRIPASWARSARIGTSINRAQMLSPDDPHTWENNCIFQYIGYHHHHHLVLI